MEIYAVLVNTT